MTELPAYTHRDHRGRPYFIGKDEHGNDVKQEIDWAGRIVPFEESPYTPVQDLFRNVYQEGTKYRRLVHQIAISGGNHPDYDRYKDKAEMLSWLLDTLMATAGMTFDDAEILVADLKPTDPF